MENLNNVSADSTKQADYMLDTLYLDELSISSDKHMLLQKFK